MLGFDGGTGTGGGWGEFGNSAGGAGSSNIGSVQGQIGHTGALGPPAAGPVGPVGPMGSGIGHDTMGNFSVSMPGPMGGPPIDAMVSAGSGPALVGSEPGAGGYNANNMGGGTPTGVGNPMGYGMGYTTPEMGPYGEFGPPQAGGYNMPGDVEGGGGEPLIRRLQGLTPEQQNFLLNDPQALRAFNQEYNRILQSGQAGNIGVGWSNDDSYTHGQYNVNAANTGGLISQGSVYNDSGSAA